MPLVFLTPYKKTYSSDICSLSSFLGLAILVAAILLPFFAAYSTEDFWLRLKEYHEQPLVDYNNTFMIYITSFKDGQFKTHFYSSNSKLNEKFENMCNNNKFNDCDLEIKQPLISSSEDIDGDGITDKLTINYEFSKNLLSNDIDKIDIKLLFFLKYGLTKTVKLIMTPMVFIDIPILNLDYSDNSNDGKEIILNGNLELVQKSPIPSTSITSMSYYITNPFKTGYNEASPFDLLYHYNKYKSNNYTVKYNYEKLERKTTDGKIKIIMQMNIPKLQEVFYIQSVFEAIKYAWMQYFYIFLPIYLILYIIFKFIIQNNIFDSHINSDL